MAEVRGPGPRGVLLPTAGPATPSAREHHRRALRADPGRRHPGRPRPAGLQRRARAMGRRRRRTARRDLPRR